MEGGLQQGGVVVRLGVEFAVLDEGRHDGVADVAVQSQAHLRLAALRLKKTKIFFSIFLWDALIHSQFLSPGPIS